MRRFLSCILISVCIFNANIAHAQSAGNCKTMKDMKYADFLKCYYKGEPPPLESRPGGGRGTVEGSRNPNAAATNITGWRSPEDPPIEGGNGVSQALNNFLNNFQNFIKKGNSGGGSGSSSGSGSGTGQPTSTNKADADKGFCPVEGERVALSESSYACGAAIPITGMTNRINNLQDNPYALAIIDDGVYQFNYFRKDTAMKKYAAVKQYKLPRFLCRWEDETDENGIITRVKVKDIDIAPPLAQLYSYNLANQAIYLKLKTLKTNFPYDLEQEFLTKNKTLLIPIKNNMPYVPKDDENNDGNLEDCDLTQTYYVDEPRNTGFFSVIPFDERVCDQGQYYLADSCEGQFITYNADDPTIIAPENTTVNAYPVEGRPEVMINTNRNSQMQIKYPSLIRLGAQGMYYFSESAAITRIGDPLLSQDDRQLSIAAPAVIDASTSVVHLANGGKEEDEGGETLKEYPANTSINLNYGLPHIVYPQGVMQTRSTMEYPTLDTSYIRKPVNPPE